MNTLKDMFMYGKIPKEMARLFFDWKRAAQIISEQKPYIAYAGYRDYRMRQRYLIYQGGIPCYPDDLIASDRDIPCLFLDSSPDPIPCYVKEYDDHEITWTPESLELLTTKIKLSDMETKGVQNDTGRESKTQDSD